MKTEDKIKCLLDRGVSIPAPASVEIGDDVQIDRISGDGVTIHGGCKILGKTTYISKGCIIGREGPVTIDDCQLAADVKINGGFVKSSVFLNKVAVGYGAHIREGSILEEEASVAHTVGLKQTILFPFVTLGSLINFCDCFMAGGTSRKDHSEVGSSYIHFNYTPNQDKATASLLGDVPRGVMLNKIGRAHV
jgi:UDP-N-acetylglucosamine/UDP-N-acetylgalactosamine diphosphorylase